MPSRKGSKGKSGTATAQKNKVSSVRKAKSGATAKAVNVKNRKSEKTAKGDKVATPNKAAKAKTAKVIVVKSSPPRAVPPKKKPDEASVRIAPVKIGTATIPGRKTNGAITTRPLERAEGSLIVHLNGHGAGGMQNGVAKTFRAASRNGDAKRSEVVLPADYRPLDHEPFMNERQRVYFRNKLLAWKDEIQRLNMETLKGLHEESSQQADPADRATAETDRALELRARDRQRKLMNKIEAALARIEDGSYGYCEETGEPISLKRLDARPIATLSIEAQEKRERRERIFRDD